MRCFKGEKGSSIRQRQRQKQKGKQTMTMKQRAEIREWLKERKEIYEKYAKEINAVQGELNHDLWFVPEDGHLKPIHKSAVMNTDSARGLIANYAYYQGAVDALYGWGFMKH
jgi:hypothetical protein